MTRGIVSTPPEDQPEDGLTGFNPWPVDANIPTSTPRGVETRNDTRRREIEHILIEFLEQEAPPPNERDAIPMNARISHCFLNIENITSMEDLAILLDDDIDNLTTETQKGGGVTQLSRIFRRRVRSVVAFYHFLCFTHNEAIDVTTFRGEQYDYFTRNSYNPGDDIARYIGAASGRKGGPGAAAGGGPTPQTPLDRWKKLKRDINEYDVFRSSKNWESFSRNVAIVASNHETLDVLDPTYVERRGDPFLVLWEEKKRWMYQVFNTKIVESSARRIVRSHFDTMNAQQVFTELIQLMQVSSAAVYEQDQLRKQIMNMKIGQTPFRGTNVQFLNKWFELVREYHELCEIRHRIDDETLKRRLRDLVSDIPEFQAITDNERQFRLQSPTAGALTYEMYMNMVLDKAQTLDASNTSEYTRSRRTTKKINVNYIGYCPYSDNYQLDNTDYQARLHIQDEDNYDADNLVEQIQQIELQRNANKTDIKTKDTFIPPKAYKQFSNSDKEAFAAMSPQVKRMFAQALQDKDKNDTKVLAHVSDVLSKENPNDVSNEEWFDTNLDTDTNEFYESLARSANKTDMNTTPAKSKMERTPPGSKKNSPDREPSSGNISSIMGSPKRDKRSTNYTEQNLHKYQVSLNNTRINKGSLIDRGANGGIAGTDTRVIHKTQRIVDISGIDDYEIVGVPIGTAGAVAQTQKGEVIVILNSYALLNKGCTIHSPAQLEHYRNKVHDKSMHVDGGYQCIITNDNYIHPIDIL